MEMKKYLRNYYTKEGIIALETRLKELIDLYMKHLPYPFATKMYGFIPLVIHSRTHHEGMIDELSQILGRENITIEVK